MFYLFIYLKIYLPRVTQFSQRLFLYEALQNVAKFKSCHLGFSVFDYEILSSCWVEVDVNLLLDGICLLFKVSYWKAEVYPISD